MGVSRVINRRTAVLGLLLVILATAGFGFAASNEVPPTGAGDGADTITGYNITNVHYDLDVANPRNISGLNFEVEAVLGGPTVAPVSVKAQIDSTGGAWYTCTTVDGTAPYLFTCTGGLTSVLDADMLRVVAAS